MTETIKDNEQDELIQRNAERIRRNEDAIRRQTECLEKIRDHYFPHRSLFKRAISFFLKVVGAVAVYAGLMETADWYWNTRRTDGMAAESARVARRLLLQENDAAGAARLLEKAVELDGNSVDYRIALASVKGMAAIVDFMDLERPLSDDERARVDSILAEALYLQDVAEGESMPFVLSASAYFLRDETNAARSAIAKAIEIEPKNVLARLTACAIFANCGDYKSAKEALKAARDEHPELPLVAYWQGMLAFMADNDVERAKGHFREMVSLAPQSAIAHASLGWILMEGPKADLKAARGELKRSLASAPKMKHAILLMAESYFREGNYHVARLWLNRALQVDPRLMQALQQRAKVLEKLSLLPAALEDLTKAIELAPFRPDLYRQRAQLHQKLGDAKMSQLDEATAVRLSQEK